MSGRILDSNGQPIGSTADPKDARIAELEALVAELQSKAQALTGKVEFDELEALVDIACAERRIVLPELRTWALHYGRRHGVEALATILGGFQPLPG